MEIIITFHISGFLHAVKSRINYWPRLNQIFVATKSPTNANEGNTILDTTAASGAA